MISLASAWMRGHHNDLVQWHQSNPAPQLWHHLHHEEVTLSDACQAHSSTCEGHSDAWRSTASLLRRTKGQQGLQTAMPAMWISLLLLTRALEMWVQGAFCMLQSTHLVLTQWNRLNDMSTLPSTRCYKVLLAGKSSKMSIMTSSNRQIFVSKKVRRGGQLQISLLSSDWLRT